MKKSNNEKFDEMLYKASEAALSDLINQYPTPEELEGRYEFSKKHKRKIGKLFKKEKSIQKGKVSGGWSKVRRFSFNAAAVICMIFTLSTLLAFTVPPIRIAITNFIIERNKEYIKIGTKSEDEAAQSESVEGAPSYIPKGYKMMNSNDSETMLMITYINEVEQIIRFNRYIGEVSLTIDGEDNNFAEIMINGNKGYISIKNNVVTIIFHDEAFTYKITSQANKEETVKIAESIIK